MLKHNLPTKNRGTVLLSLRERWDISLQRDEYERL
jgi:hypothetical protein